MLNCNSIKNHLFHLILLFLIFDSGYYEDPNHLNTHFLISFNVVKPIFNTFSKDYHNYTI
ncbi:hypothetical protein GYY_07940 [Methanococcus maripaludis X1]|uniref:Uncharacterized protein n=1 Tax=Methanococcus maripaludis X1 TaxID=1053692 RepID=G0H2G7_METMI|nr:hypothetical protein GYY_07940 [Methanococcus maripaludis X1]